VHLFYNLLGLLWVGICLESATNIKRRNILIAFFLSDIVSDFGILAVASPTVVAMGASSAIMGLLGVLVLVVPAFFVPVFAWAAIGVVIDPFYVSHIVGLLVGVFLGIYWRFRKSQGFT